MINMESFLIGKFENSINLVIDNSILNLHEIGKNTNVCSVKLEKKIFFQIEKKILTKVLDKDVEIGLNFR